MLAVLAFQNPALFMPSVDRRTNAKRSYSKTGVSSSFRCLCCVSTSLCLCYLPLLKLASTSPRGYLDAVPRGASENLRESILLRRDVHVASGVHSRSGLLRKPKKPVPFAAKASKSLSASALKRNDPPVNTFGQRSQDASLHLDTLTMSVRRETARAVMAENPQAYCIKMKRGKGGPRQFGDGMFAGDKFGLLRSNELAVYASYFI